MDELAELISTQAEADAAPLGTVALNHDRTEVWEKTGRPSVPWQSLTGGGFTYSDAFVRSRGPLVVIANLSIPTPDQRRNP